VRCQCWKKAGAVTIFRKKVETENGGRDFWTFRSSLYYSSEGCVLQVIKNK